MNTVKTIEIKEVTYDAKNNSIIFYYEDEPMMKRWKEHHPKEKLATPFLRDIEYDLNNPNQAFDILIKMRKWLTGNQRCLSGSDLYKNFQSYDKWFR